MATPKKGNPRELAKLAAFGRNYGMSRVKVDAQMETVVGGRVADALGLDTRDVLVAIERVFKGQDVLANAEVRIILLGDPDETKPLFGIHRLAELDNDKLRLTWPRLAPREKRAACRTAFELGGFDAAWALVSST